MDVSTDELAKYGAGQRKAYAWCACCLRKKCELCHFFARRLPVACCRQLSSLTRSLSCYTVPFLYTSAPLRFSLASWALSDGLDTSCMQANSSHHHIHHHVLSQGWESVARWRYSSVRSIVYNNDNNEHFLSASSHPRALFNGEWRAIDNDYYQTQTVYSYMLGGYSAIACPHAFFRFLPPQPTHPWTDRHTHTNTHYYKEPWCITRLNYQFVSPCVCLVWKTSRHRELSFSFSDI